MHFLESRGDAHHPLRVQHFHHVLQRAMFIESARLSVLVASPLCEWNFQPIEIRASSERVSSSRNIQTAAAAAAAVAPSSASAECFPKALEPKVPTHSQPSRCSVP